MSSNPASVFFTCSVTAPAVARPIIGEYRTGMQPAAINAQTLDRRHHSPAARRFIGGTVAAGSGGVLSIAALMTPAAGGVGTHRQLNLPECGWITLMDMPCLTCGMTTSFSHAVRGELLASMLVQPMGFLLAMATAMALLVGLHMAITGSRLPMLVARLWCGRTLVLLAILAGAAWLFKIVTYKGWIA